MKTSLTLSLSALNLFTLVKYSSAEDETVLKEENLSAALLINLSPSFKVSRRPV